MTLFSGILVYIVTWWMVFFCVLPFGIHSIEKSTDGSMPGAPVNPQMKRKAILVTLLSCVIWVGIYAIIKSDLISFREIAQHMDM